MKSPLIPEQQLQLRLQSLSEEYSAILSSLDRIRTAVQTDPSRGSAATAQLEELVARVRRQEQTVHSVKTSWEQLGRPDSGNLRAVIRSAAMQLEQLILSVQECERLVRTSRDELIPRCDELSRRRQMHRAYSGVGHKR